MMHGSLFLLPLGSFSGKTCFLRVIPVPSSPSTVRPRYHCLRFKFYTLFTHSLVASLVVSPETGLILSDQSRMGCYLDYVESYYPSTKDGCEGVKFVTKVNDILDTLRLVSQGQRKILSFLFHWLLLNCTGFLRVVFYTTSDIDPTLEILEIWARGLGGNFHQTFQGVDQSCSQLSNVSPRNRNYYYYYCVYKKYQF